MPFCARRCSYCDFSIAVRRNVPVEAFVDAIGVELHQRTSASPADRPRLDTLYLGGGTPSRLGSAGVRALIARIRTRVDLAPDAEVTLEANPEDITSHAVAEWMDAGVNRLSIGVQSFSDQALEWMHRVHDADSAARAVAIARDGGITDFSVDLIFSLPAFLQRDWHDDVTRVVALQPTHVSLYGLTIEEHTPLGRWRARGDVTEAPEEQFEREFLEADVLLRSAGFEHYEVSNYARPGHRARHNSAYWVGTPYLALGPSAHGFDGHSRYWNTAAYADWHTRLASGEGTIGGTEALTAENRVAETVYLGLRTSAGLLVSPAEWKASSRWVDEGWVVALDAEDGRRMRCTPLGWLRLDALAAGLTARRSHS